MRILGEEVVLQRGTFRRVRQYVAGWHPELGTLHFGWSGRETIVEVDRIMPVQVVVAGGEAAETARPSQD